MPIHKLISLLKKLTGMGKASEQLTEALDQVKKDQDLDPNLVKMMESILKLSTQQVRDIMIPRANMKVIAHTDSYQQTLETALAAKHSRYPVISNNKDEIIGILLAKSLLICHKNNQKPPTDITELCMPAHFVPESKRLDSLLKEFLKNHIHMAIVLDEYGGVAGLVTLEDVIEEITGEIEDEDFDETEPMLIRKKNDNVYIISGLTPLPELNDALDTKFVSSTIDTFGGYIAQHLGFFPEPKQTFKIGNLTCKIQHVDHNRICSIEVTKDEN